MFELSFVIGLLAFYESIDLDNNKTEIKYLNKDGKLSCPKFTRNSCTILQKSQNYLGVSNFHLQVLKTRISNNG